MNHSKTNGLFSTIWGLGAPSFRKYFSQSATTSLCRSTHCHTIQSNTLYREYTILGSPINNMQNGDDPLKPLQPQRTIPTTSYGEKQTSTVATASYLKPRIPCTYIQCIETWHSADQRGSNRLPLCCKLHVANIGSPAPTSLHPPVALAVAAPTPQRRRPCRCCTTSTSTSSCSCFHQHRTITRSSYSHLEIWCALRGITLPREPSSNLTSTPRRQLVEIVVHIHTTD